MITSTLSDPGQIKDNSGLITFLGEAKAAIEDLRKSADPSAAIERATSDFSEKFRKIEEQLAAPKFVNRDVTGTDRDLAKYVKADGSLRLLGGTETVTFKGSNGKTITAEVDVPGLVDDVELASPWQRDLQRKIGERKLIKLAMGGGATPNTDRDIASLIARAPAGMRDIVARAFVDSATAGAEWIPDRFSPEVYMAFEAPTVLASLFGSVSLSGPTVKPKMTGQARPYKLSAINGDDPAVLTPCSVTTSSQTLDPGGFYVRMVVDKIASEDAAVAVIPMLQANMVKTMIDGYEDCIVNGDTAGTHQDAIATWNARSRWGASGLGGSADHRRTFLGLRALAFDRTATVDQSAGQTIAKIMEELFGAMGELAMQDGVICTSPEVFFKKLLLDSNVYTVDKFGPAATIRTGQLGAAGGRPIVVSRWVTADLATTGLYTGTGAYSGVLAFTPGAFAHYVRRGPSVEVEVSAKTQSTDLVITQRKAMDTLTASTEKVSTFGFKWL